MSYSTTPQSKQTFDALWRLEKIILDNLKFDEVVQKIVDSTVLELGYLNLGYEIIVLCLLNKEEQTLHRISVSQTERASQTLDRLNHLHIPFHNIVIPLTEKENILIKAINNDEPSVCSDWYELLRPMFSPETAQHIQRELGIKASLIFPVRTSNETIGAMIFSMSKNESEVTSEEHDLIRSFTDVVGLAVQNAAVFTALERTKQKLEQANEELKQLDHLKDEFLSMASHELKSPMNAIKNYLWLAQHKGKDDSAKMDEYLQVAYQFTQRLIVLVNDLLDVSRVESGRVQLTIVPIPIAQTVKETIDIFEPTAHEKGLIIHNLITTADHLMGDDMKVRQILSNFISNAIKYTPSGSITLSASSTEKTMTIAITDTGLGITPVDQQKLFQRFSRVNSSYKELATIEGTGLGLYICKKYIELMNGGIGMDSEIGKGSRFWFSLPCA